MSQIMATARALTRAFSRATRAAQAGQAIFAWAWFREPRLYILGSLNHAHALLTCPAWAARVAREKACDNARAVAVIWDMHVLINQLIECKTPSKRNFYNY